MLSWALNKSFVSMSSEIPNITGLYFFDVCGWLGPVPNLEYIIDLCLFFIVRL